MTGISGLVPARFLCLIAHMVITIVILLSRGDNVRAGLPRQFTQSDYDQKDMEFTIGLSVSLGLLSIELGSFLGGVSMFMPMQGMLSTATHSSACITLAYFIFDAWQSDTFWYVFGFCSCLPVLSEIMVIIGVAAFNRGL